MAELLAGATERTALAEAPGKSGATLERVVIGGQDYVLKHVDLAEVRNFSAVERIPIVDYEAPPPVEVVPPDGQDWLGYGELLGGHIIGHDVSELLPELTLAQKWDLTATELARNVHTHPTMSEALQECFHGLVGHMINF